jgi:hypothetical protein
MRAKDNPNDHISGEGGGGGGGGGGLTGNAYTASARAVGQLEHAAGIIHKRTNYEKKRAARNRKNN